MADISATEIKRQASRLREETEKFLVSCNNLSKQFLESKNAIDGGSSMTVSAGADSALYESLAKYDEAYTTLSKIINQKFTNLATIMEAWANKTIANEEAQSQTVKDITNKASEINDVLGTLNK